LEFRAKSFRGGTFGLNNGIKRAESMSLPSRAIATIYLTVVFVVIDPLGASAISIF